MFKTNLRKNIARLKKSLASTSGDDRLDILREIQLKQFMLKHADTMVSQQQMPTLGKLRLVLENELQQEEIENMNKTPASDNDWKRWALKSAVYDYYMDLPYDPETIAVDYEGDLTARRDDQDVDGTDVDLAPNKNTIYQLWMDKLGKLIRENKLSPAEFDEAAERGTPQGGAFEKQLDRYRKEFMNKLWQDYYKNYKQ